MDDPLPSMGGLAKTGATLVVLESGAGLLNVLIWGWILDHVAI